MSAFLAALLAGLGALLSKAFDYVSKRLTWRRLLILGMFGTLLASAGTLIASVAQTMIASFDLLANASVAITDISARNSSIGHTIVSGIPLYVHYFAYRAGLDWVLWVLASILNFSFWGWLLRRSVRWGLALVRGIMSVA